MTEVNENKKSLKNGDLALFYGRPPLQYLGLDLVHLLCSLRQLSLCVFHVTRMIVRYFCCECSWTNCLVWNADMNNAASI